MSKQIKPCIECHKDFEYKLPECCSNICANRAIAKKNIFWKTATDEQKLERARVAFKKHVIRFDDEDKCWDWDGYFTKQGYAKIRFNESNCFAHRVSWMIHNNQILPKGKKVIMHSCDNVRCTNPKHLILGTYKENNKDKAIKGRSSKLLDYY